MKCLATLRLLITEIGPCPAPFRERAEDLLQHRKLLVERGQPAGATFGLGVDDLAIAADQLRSTMAAPSILVGHSLGGAAVLAIAARVPEARAVVTLAMPADAAQVGDLGQIGMQPQRQRIATLRRALLVIHSPDDEAVGIDNARVIFEAARHPKSFISLDGADHLLTRPADASYAASVIAAWATRYLPGPEGPDIRTPPAGPARHGVVVVTESDARPYGQCITVGGHHLVADEPAAVGGADSGPTPYDLLLAGLGACTAITIRMYADRKGWPRRPSGASTTPPG